jgi:integrase
MHPILLDAAGHRRQPVTLPGYHAGRPPRNKGRRYPADPPTVEEIIAVMRTAGAGADGVRLRALIVLLWRAGMRIGEALALAETDLDARRGAVLIRHGKGDKRREVGMDRWAWEQLEPWQQRRVRLPVGPLLCVIHGPTAGRAWEQASARRQLARTAAAAGIRRRFAPHQLRHAHAVELAHEQIPLVVIQRLQRPADGARAERRTSSASDHAARDSCACVELEHHCDTAHTVREAARSARVAASDVAESRAQRLPMQNSLVPMHGSPI